MNHPFREDELQFWPSYKTEIESLPIGIIGDWRTNDDAPFYDAKKGANGLWFSGAIGYYYFGRGEWLRAIKAWKDELKIIAKAEETEGKRLHKGWFYYQIARAYHGIEEGKNFAKYLRMAEQEDALSYGENASTFPAANINKGGVRVA